MRSPITPLGDTADVNEKHSLEDLVLGSMGRRREFVSMRHQRFACARLSHPYLT